MPKSKKNLHNDGRAAVGDRAPVPHAHARSDAATLIVGVALLAAALAAVYVPALKFPLIYDDALSIDANASIRQLWPLWGTAEQLGPLKPAKDLPTAGRPVVNVSFALNYFWGALEPAGYRATNLAIHFLSAVLLLLVVRRTLRLEYFAGRFHRVATPLALAVALVWALHPLQTEPVAYVTQRSELLMAFCYLATLYCALRYWDCTSSASRVVPDPDPFPAPDSPGPHKRIFWLILAILSCAAGMASKESMVAAPLVVLMYDWTFVSRSLRRSLRESWPLYAGLAATWLVLLALNAHGPRSLSAGFHFDVSLWDWWATQAKIFWIYLKLAAWPWPLMIRYELPYVDTFATGWPWLVLAAVVVIGTLYLLWRQRSAGFVAATALVTLAPTSIVPILTEVAAERRMYLPLAPLAALAVIGAFVLLNRWFAAPSTNHTAVVARPLAVFLGIALFVAIIEARVSAHRLEAYESMISLWRDNLRHDPTNFIVTYNLACCLDAAGQPGEAVRYFERAAQLKPGLSRVHLSMSGALARAGRLEDAVRHLEEVVRLEPNEFANYPKLAQGYVDTNRPTEAIATAEKAIELARAAGQAAAVEQVEAWLAAYRAKLAAPEPTSPEPKSTSP